MSGHSMGGMGITRSFNLLADTFSFFLPIAAGMDLDYAPVTRTEWQINKSLNNVIIIDLPAIPKQTKALRVYDVVINGQRVATRAPAPGAL